MRINAIGGLNSVHSVKNRTLQHSQSAVQTGTTDVQNQNVSFKGNELKIGLAAAGAIIGGLISGPMGAIIGAAAGLKGAQYAEEEESVNEANKKNSNNKK